MSELKLPVLTLTIYAYPDRASDLRGSRLHAVIEKSAREYLDKEIPTSDKLSVMTTTGTGQIDIFIEEGVK